jgi:predicted ATPase/DNA-binding SARP family transcriptional activator
MGEHMRIEVLGPLQVRSRGSVVDVGSPRHHEVLAALAVDAGRVVSSDLLLERVWGESRRGASSSNLHAAISRLRGWLQAPSDSVTALEIVTVSRGYRLSPASAVDAVAFQDLVADARRAFADGELLDAHGGLTAALALWRGPAYADIRLPFAEVEAARLDGQRLSAYELLVDVEMELGRVDAVLDRLATLVTEQPLREAFRAQQMLALYRSGRQAEALEVYGQLRTLLSEELGIDPAPQLQELHQRILEQDDDLRAPVALTVATVTDSAAPSATVTQSPERTATVLGDDRLAPQAPVDDPPPPWHSEVVVPAVGLVGRSREVRYLHELLATSTQRLVTITGVGGVGKTRLAYAVADSLRQAYPDGIGLVSLAPLGDPDLVLPAIGRAFGLSAVEGLDPLETVAQHLRSRRVLVVVDNFEHLMDAASGLARLVALCPRINVLVTSRTTLRVRGELHYQLSPLTLPDADDELAAVVESAAVALFVDRAQDVRPNFRLDADNAGPVGGICRRLAGIPLAIELAAARAHLLEPDTMLARLDRVMAGAGARDLPPRQRTMRTAIDWSYQLLEPDAQRLFRQLAVFVDGFTLDAVEATHADLHEPAGPTNAPALELLETLVENSLVLRDDDHAHAVRFRMLEPVAQFAATCLKGDEERAVRDAHLRFFLDLAERTEPGYRGSGTIGALALTQREHANFVAALEWGARSQQGDLAGRLVWALWLFWWLRGHLLEGRRLASAVLAGQLSDEVRARAHAVLGAMAFAQGDLDGAREWSVGAQLSRRINDVTALSHNLAGEGLIALAEERLAEAEQKFVDTVALTDKAGLQGEWLWTLAHVWQGTVRLLLGKAHQATPLLEAALAAARQRDDPLAIYIALFTSVQVSVVSGDLEMAREQLQEGILLSVDTGDMANLAYFLEALAVVESLQGHVPRVPVMYGAASALRESVGSNVYGYYRPDETLLADALAGARAQMGPAFETAVQQGRNLSLSDAVALATAAPEIHEAIPS